ncbi:hypothetical protein Ddc_15329 [Ditylenchus destructor]|nr:hypothetical protein Ddc_15329 [Ditylenchus destructor]
MTLSLTDECQRSCAQKYKNEILNNGAPKTDTDVRQVLIPGCKALIRSGECLRKCGPRQFYSDKSVVGLKVLYDALIPSCANMEDDFILSKCREKLEIELPESSILHILNIGKDFSNEAKCSIWLEDMKKVLPMTRKICGNHEAELLLKMIKKGFVSLAMLNGRKLAAKCKEIFNFKEQIDFLDAPMSYSISNLFSPLKIPKIVCYFVKFPFC